MASRGAHAGGEREELDANQEPVQHRRAPDYHALQDATAPCLTVMLFKMPQSCSSRCHSAMPQSQIILPQSP
eukprot:1158553-Pelagomonas_calceolata.AAC.3